LVRAKTRVAMVTEAFAGGVYEWLKLVCPELAQRGFDITLAYWPRPESPPKPVLERDFPACRLVDLSRVTDGRGPVKYVRGLAAFLDRERPDILHLHSSWAGMAGRVVLVSRRRGRLSWRRRPEGHTPTGVYYTPHCFAFLRRDLSLAMRALIWGAERLLARTPGVVCVACGPGERRLAERLGATVVKAYNGVAPQNGWAGPAAANVRTGPAAPLARGWPPGSLGAGGHLVLSGGRLDPQKDPLFMIEVAARVLTELRDEAGTSAALAIRTSPEALTTGAGPEVRFVWVGSGRLEAGLRRGLERLEPGVREGLVFLPWAQRPEFLEALSQATVYLHTARWEGLSLAILEAMAAGTPVVARRGPGCHEVVEETGCGVVARDAKEAADAVLALLADASARRDLAKRGRAAVRSTYNLERLVSDLAALYETTGGR